ncbi:phage tail spike protein [Macrococcus armenti]|uniref:phage tail spike protein n=1 Tax=Macrococcus armenti TaxID=2875764 RepID=UPI001CD27602|nr:phage tail spike protein [Macrococcus armenti]UBH10588.1 phage tail protein [Macrococcus armenti]
MPVNKNPILYDTNMKRIAYLHNAYDISYELIKNKLATCSFSMPLNDAKMKLVQPKYFIELWDHHKRVGMFVVNPKNTTKNESTNEVTFECEHVLSLLHSSVIFGYMQMSNYTTTQVLQALFNKQLVNHFRLGRCALTRYFHYGFENSDSLLNSIMSVFEPINEDYLINVDDSVYPFVFNVDKSSSKAKDLITVGRNMKGIDVEDDPTDICTRIYPLGHGEGINQLTIKKVNGGVPYLQAPQSVIDKYGLHARIWADKRYENPTTLKNDAQKILDNNMTPKRSYKINVAHTDVILSNPTDYKAGDVIRVYDKELRINEDNFVEKYKRSGVYESPDNLTIEIGSVRKGLGSKWSDLQKKQMVNDVYSQGATNIDSRDFQDNADDKYPAVIRFPIPEDVVNINQMTLTYELSKFRATNRTLKSAGALVDSTSSGGSIVKSTSSGGGSVQTSSSGGGTTQSSTSGGGGTWTSAAGGGSVQSTTTKTFAQYNLMTGAPENAVGSENYGNHMHEIQISGEHFEHDHSVTIPAHSHNVSIPEHNHSVTIPAHTHNTQIPAHDHQIDIPNHVHSINIPGHTHEIEYGIFENPKEASSVEITVDGTKLSTTATSGQNIDLLPYLKKNSDGDIERGRYAEIIIKPNDLARINATVTSRLFIQSRIGVTM